MQGYNSEFDNPTDAGEEGSVLPLRRHLEIWIVIVNKDYCFHCKKKKKEIHNRHK